MRLALALSLSLTALPLAAATVYKWRDATGQVHYSQTPPPTGKASDAKIDTRHPGVIMQGTPAPKPAEADATTEKKPAGAEVAAAPETREAKTKRCADAEARLSFLIESTARRLMVSQPDGTQARMSEEDYEQNLSKAREASKGC